MVLYGIWLIDANSGLLLSHVTVPGFTFNPELFSGFIAANYDFAKEASGGQLNTIALGNFKLLIQRDRILMKVLAVGARDPEARYDQFFRNLEAEAEPLLAQLHREPDGFKAVTIEFRKSLLEIITSELEGFATRKAPSDLKELAILQEQETSKLVRSLLQQQCAELIPELAITKLGYSYPLASALTGLEDEEAMRLLERIADYGLLLTEPIETALACPKCNSLHLHPHLLCPKCQCPAQPVELYEHITCGNISVRIKEAHDIYCDKCGVLNSNDHEFRIFRGYQCSECNSSFKDPLMTFTCHACHTTTKPEGAVITVLKKYVLNPVLISELEYLLVEKSTHRRQIQFSQSKSQSRSLLIGVKEIPDSSIPLADASEDRFSPLPNESISLVATPSSIVTTDSQDKGLEGNETQVVDELNQLESALSSGTITEAEYDRKFILLRLQLRRLRTQSPL